MTLRTQESILESVETGPDQHSNSFRDIVMRDAEEADTGVVSYFFIFVQLPGDPYKICSYPCDQKLFKCHVVRC